MMGEGGSTSTNEATDDCVPVVTTSTVADEKIPRLKKKGLPLWLFKIIRWSLLLFPFDAYVMFPPLLLIIAAILGAVSAFVTGREKKLVFWVIMGVLGAVAMIIWLHWARQNQEFHRNMMWLEFPFVTVSTIGHEPPWRLCVVN